MLYLYVNALGLLFDIAGVILVYMYGLPVVILPGGAEAVWHTPSDPVEKEKKEAKYARHKFWSSTGLSLLIAGFGCQLASTVVQIACRNLAH